jgi:hypothetical protein
MDFFSKSKIHIQNLEKKCSEIDLLSMKDVGLYGGRIQWQRMRQQPHREVLGVGDTNVTRASIFLEGRENGKLLGEEERVRRWDDSRGLLQYIWRWDGGAKSNPWCMIQRLWSWFSDLQNLSIFTWYVPEYLPRLVQVQPTKAYYHSSCQNEKPTTLMHKVI